MTHVQSRDLSGGCLFHSTGRGEIAGESLDSQGEGVNGRTKHTSVIDIAI